MTRPGSILHAILGHGYATSEQRKVAAEIRTFVERDRDALRALFRRAGEGAPSASIWGHEDSEAAVYLTPYMDLEPDSLFVSVVDGELTGYLAGCIDSAAFPSESERMGRAIRQHRLVLRPRLAPFFARAVWDTVLSGIRREPTAGELEDARWPAHLHINVLPKVRGTGVADALMHRWLARLRHAGAPGCYLQTLVENTRAVRFFERMGFARHGPTSLVPGLRHGGRRLHQQTMVRNC